VARVGGARGRAPPQPPVLRSRHLRAATADPHKRLRDRYSLPNRARPRAASHTAGPPGPAEGADIPADCAPEIALRCGRFSRNSVRSRCFRGGRLSGQVGAGPRGGPGEGQWRCWAVGAAPRGDPLLLLLLLLLLGRGAGLRRAPCRGGDGGRLSVGSGGGPPGDPRPAGPCGRGGPGQRAGPGLSPGAAVPRAGRELAALGGGWVAFTRCGCSLAGVLWTCAVRANCAFFLCQLGTASRNLRPIGCKRLLKERDGGKREEEASRKA